MLDKLNSTINSSFVGRYFQMEERKTNFTTEFAGATATFLTVAYILAVNPRILSASGGPCKGDIFSPEYEQCMEDIKREFITSTALCSMVGCLLMGLVANLPIALAPGMGLNAYFTYSVVGWRGTGSVSYEAAVTAVAIEGAIFFVLAVTGARFAIVRLIPEPVKVATPAGIGAFLAHLGLQTAEGIGLVVSDIATAVTLGACPLENRTPIVAYTEACASEGICVTSDAYTCDDLGGVMTSGPTWVGLLGLIIMAILLGYKSKFAFLAGIGFVTVISWFRNSAVTYFDDSVAGTERFEYFKSVVRVETLDMTLAPFTNDLGGISLALLTFLYVDFFDTSGTLLGLANSMGIVDENGDFPGSRKAFSCDALATLFGSFFGMSPITSYIESGAGVEIGSKTGLTAVIVAIYFFISIFFAPIIASIPPWASGGALVIVGSLMAKNLANVQWNKVSHALPAFLTVMIMPLTYSIAYGLIAGIVVYYIMEGTYLLLSYAGIKSPSADEATKDEQDVKVEPAFDENEGEKAAKQVEIA